MSFANLNLPKLQYAAEVFKLDGIDEHSTRKEIIAAIKERGISWQNYKKFVEKEEELEEVNDEVVKPEVENIVLEDAPKLPGAQPAEEKFNNMVLLKMDRQNARFDVLGYTFTREHPYKALPEEEAQRIIDLEDGFRLASPKEAREYYS